VVRGKYVIAKIGGGGKRTKEKGMMLKTEENGWQKAYNGVKAWGGGKGGISNSQGLERGGELIGGKLWGGLRKKKEYSYH